MLAVICTVKHSANRPLKILSPLRFSRWFLFCDIKVNSTVLSWYFSLNFTLILSLPVGEKVNSLLSSVDHGCKLPGFVKHPYLLPSFVCVDAIQSTVIQLCCDIFLFYLAVLLRCCQFVKLVSFCLCFCVVASVCVIHTHQHHNHHQARRVDSIGGMSSRSCHLPPKL